MTKEEVIKAFNSLTESDKVEVLQEVNTNMAYIKPKDKVLILVNLFYNAEYKELSLSHLNFEDYDFDVNISHLRVNGSLYQSYQEADDIEQDHQKVVKNLTQIKNTVGGVYKTDMPKMEDTKENNKIETGKLITEFKALSEEDKIKFLKSTGINIYNISPKDKAEIVYNMFYNKYDNCIDLEGLDFTDRNCDVNVSHLSVKGNLWQNWQSVVGDVYQDYQCVGKDLIQDSQEVCGNVRQGGNTVGGDLSQECHEVKGNLWQGHHMVWGNLSQGWQNVIGTFEVQLLADDEYYEIIHGWNYIVKKGKENGTDGNKENIRV